MELIARSRKREDIIDITEQVEKAVEGIRDGICWVYTPHATCAIIINENYDPNVCEDILLALRKLFPQGKWLHDKIDSNADAHIKSAILGPSEAIPIKDGKLQMGTWQSIMLADFDGPRERKIVVKVLGRRV